MIFTRRGLGVSLFAVAGLAFIDWCLALVAFRGPPAIVGLILYGELYSHSISPLPLITPIYQVVAPLIHLLFIVASVAAGRYLRQSGLNRLKTSATLS